MSLKHPIPEHIVAPGPSRPGYVLRVYLDGEVSSSAWSEVHRIEGWGVRYIIDEFGVLQKEDDEYATERVEGVFTCEWLKLD